MRVSLTVDSGGIREKIVAPTSSKSGRVYLPISWIGKKVLVILTNDVVEEGTYYDDYDEVM